MEARKKAIIRRHGYGSVEASEAAKVESTAACEDASTAELAAVDLGDTAGTKSWAQKRKEHALKRAGLDVGADKNELDSPAEPEGSLVREFEAMRAEEEAEIKARKAAERQADGTWAHRRAEHIRARAREKPKEADVAVQTVMFASKLKRLSSARLAEQSAASEAPPEPPAGAAALALTAFGAKAAPKAASNPLLAALAAAAAADGGTEESHQGEDRGSDALFWDAELEAPPKAEPHTKSWAQRRKNAYLTRHGAKPKPLQVTTTTITFAAKLKRQAALSRSLRDSTASGS